MSKKAMKPVMYSCPYVPPEWIAAHGLTPSRILPSCPAQTETVDISFGLCPYTRGFIGEVLQSRNHTAVVLTTVCDQMRRAADYISRRSDIPCFLMHVPATWQNSAAHTLYASELERLGQFLIKLGGQKPTGDQLIQVMLQYDDMRRTIRDSQPFTDAIEFARALAHFHQTSKFTLEVNGKKPRTEGVPLMVLGGPFLKDDLHLFSQIETYGGRVVLDASEFGLRTLAAPFPRRRIKENPLRELVDAYFGSICDVFRRPNSELYRWLKQKIAETHVRGIILHRYVWCDIWHGEVQRLKEWTELPVLDLNRGDEEYHTQNRTEVRLQAFLEMLR